MYKGMKFEQSQKYTLHIGFQSCNPVCQLDLLGLRGEAPKLDFANTLWLNRMSSKNVYQTGIISYASNG